MGHKVYEPVFPLWEQYSGSPKTKQNKKKQLNSDPPTANCLP